MNDFKFASLGSGSRGNGVLISCGDTHVLVDCGFSMKSAIQRLARLDIAPEALAAIIVTHEHSDHVKGVPILARKFLTPVYMTEGTFNSRSYGVIPDLRMIRDYASFSVGELLVTPVPVLHDAAEPAQFVFSSDCRKLGVLTDLGSATLPVVAAYDGCDGLFIEANHDRAMLAHGPYPQSLKERVSGPWGHLSNDQTVELLEQLDTSRLQHLVVGHISEKNNTVEHARKALKLLSKPIGNVHFACQELGINWIHLQ